MFHNHIAGGCHPGVELHAALRRLGRRWAQFNPAARAPQRGAPLRPGRPALRVVPGSRLAVFLRLFPHRDETLDEAQAAKKHHIAAKLLLDRPGLTVLDIGCGWGGLALTLAQDYGARVTGITLSAEQLARARMRAAQAGVSDRVRFELLDYRDAALAGPFDRIVSVGMFEHVGINHYRRFFSRLRALLAPGGVALVHCDRPVGGAGGTNPWLQRHIFPGGYSPALSEVFPAVERSGLQATDLEILRLHYADTLRHWRRRFAARRAEAAALYDERFCRMFEFYLAGSELAFRRLGHMVWQMQLSRGGRAVPRVRDYLAQKELSAVREAAD